MKQESAPRYDVAMSHKILMLDFFMLSTGMDNSPVELGLDWQKLLKRPKLFSRWFVFLNRLDTLERRPVPKSLHRTSLSGWFRTRVPSAAAGVQWLLEKSCHWRILFERCFGSMIRILFIRVFFKYNKKKILRRHFRQWNNHFHYSTFGNGMSYNT